MTTTYTDDQLNDEALVRQLPGFKNAYAQVNGIRLHHVEGGKGHPLVLLPSWPETWWAYHKIMPLLAEHFHVITVDIRGIGSSDKPADGYDKKSMAKDISNLVGSLGYEKVCIAGHDIGATIAYSFVAQFPELTARLILLDTPPLDENIYRLPMLPVPGTSMQEAGEHPYPWWLAFNQVQCLPEQLLEGRIHLLHNYIFSCVGIKNSSISAFDKAVYAAAYNSSDAIRAGNAWYQAFPQDVLDSKTYEKLQMPVLGIGGSGYEMLKFALPGLTNDFTIAHIPKGGHFFFEEQAEETSRLITGFLL